VVRFIAAIALVGCGYFRTLPTTPMVEVAPEPPRPPEPPSKPASRRWLLLPGTIVGSVGTALIITGAVRYDADLRAKQAYDDEQSMIECMQHPGFLCGLVIDLAPTSSEVMLMVGAPLALAGIILTIVGATGHK
jgi:hypothetical protein